MNDPKNWGLCLWSKTGRCPAAGKGAVQCAKTKGYCRELEDSAQALKETP